MTDWTGPYIGAVAGGTCMDTDTTYTIDYIDPGDTDSTSDPTLNGCGFSGGLVAGFNYQFGSAVVGIEGDIVWGGKTGELTYIDSVGGIMGESYSISWMSSMRARLGYLMNNDTLLYITGGPAWMKGNLRDKISGQNFTRTHFGYTVGGGLEHAFTENIHLRAEYLYANFNNKRYGPYVCGGCGLAGANITATNDMNQFHSFRAGVTWNFPVSSW